MPFVIKKLDFFEKFDIIASIMQKTFDFITIIVFVILLFVVFVRFTPLYGVLLKNLTAGYGY